MIKLIWAQTKEGVIGNDNALPWTIKEEMQHFRQTTLNSAVLMGRKTFLSMQNKPLPNRVNYVLTRDVKAKQKNQNNLYFINDLSDVIKKYQHKVNDDLYVIGGNAVISKAIDLADEIIRTIIKKDCKGNIKIDELNFTNFDKIKIVEKEDFYIEYFKRRNHEK